MSEGAGLTNKACAEYRSISKKLVGNDRIVGKGALVPAKDGKQQDPNQNLNGIEGNFD